MPSELQNEFMDLLRAEAEAVMAFGGIPTRTAKDLARSLCERIVMQAGGDALYVPSGARVKRSRALADIESGVPPAIICRRYHISRRTLQRWRKSDIP